MDFICAISRCVCASVNTWLRLNRELFKGINLWPFLLFYWECTLCDLSSRTVNFEIIKYLYDFLWAAVNKVRVKNCDSKTKGGFTYLRKRKWQNEVLRLLLRILWRKINPIMSLPPCGGSMSLYIFLLKSVNHVKYLKSYKINAMLASCLIFFSFISAKFPLYIKETFSLVVIGESEHII